MRVDDLRSPRLVQISTKIWTITKTLNCTHRLLQLISGLLLLLLVQCNLILHNKLMDNCVSNIHRGDSINISGWH